MSKELVTALSASGKDRPTVIQSSSFEPIISGQDVIIGSETGLDSISTLGQYNFWLREWENVGIFTPFSGLNFEGRNPPDF